MLRTGRSDQDLHESLDKIISCGRLISDVEAGI